jgi:hypothetical protein
MAMILKQKYDLLVLKLSLDTWSREVSVRCDLEVKEAGELKTVAQWVCSPESIGLPARLDERAARSRKNDYRIPGDVVEELKNQIDRLRHGDRPLWLHLQKPYGFLGVVPWEMLLQPRLGIPILRLPDFVVRPPSEAPGVLDVVLCGSAPAAKQPFALVEHFDDLIPRIFAASDRRTNVHVFVDADVFPLLNQRWAQGGRFGGRVHLNDPVGAERYAPDQTASTQLRERPGRVQNPWLLWMQEALGGRSVDMVHLVGHGFVAAESGAIAFAESPLQNRDRRVARFIGATQLSAFLTSVGAWGAGISAAENNFSDAGLRLLADSLAQFRPGPVVYHDFEDDWTAEALTGAYRLLFGNGPQPAPASPALFIYCQPFRVAEPRGARRPRGALLGSARDERHAAFSLSTPEIAPVQVPTSEAVEFVFKGEENVPNWMAATERFVEQQIFDLNRKAPGAVDRTHADVTRTLSQLQEIAARLARAEGGNA